MEQLLTAHIPAIPWGTEKLPLRILVIRLQAMGDVMITLPYLQHLRNTLPPDVRIDFLTRDETADIPQNIVLFNKVFVIKGKRNFKKQLLHTFLLLPRLVMQRYDVVIDLQHNVISKIVRKAIIPKAWSVFDRYAPLPAGERTRQTIEAVGLGKNKLYPHLQLKEIGRGVTLLHQYGWNGTDTLVILNPAAAFVTRNWNMEYYINFARLWLERFPDTRFLVLGTSFIAEKAAYLKSQLGDRLISLVGCTTPFIAFEIIQQAGFVLSEDSGLMHMAWVSGIPTFALFGGTRSDWSRPLGEHTAFLDASDLPCGGCMQETCRYGDVHCLTRFTPRMVFDQALQLLQRNVRADHL